MPINVDKYIDADSQDTPIIRYVEKNVAEKRYGVDVTDLLGPINANGGYNYPNGGHSLDLSALTYGVGVYAFAYKFYKSSITGDVTINISFVREGAFSHAFEQTYITSFSADKITEITDTGVFEYSFNSASRLKSVSFKNLVRITTKNRVFDSAFSYATELEDADFGALQEIDAYWTFNHAFENTKINQNPMPNLQRITGHQILYYAFAACLGIENFVFDRLGSVLGSSNLARAFFGCTNLRVLSFPSLREAGESTFSNMLLGCSDVMVHFPSNLQAVIGEWDDVINGFGGTNTTVLFDLPEME